MSRIKFRIYSTEEEEMFSNEDIVNIDLVCSFARIETDTYKGFFDFGKDEESIVMQFTGLFDDEGKEIYEGDIVEIQNTYETKTSYISQVYLTHNGAIVGEHPVHVKMGHDEYRQLSGFCDYGCGGMYHVKCKIKGNIYQNPELLN